MIPFSEIQLFFVCESQDHSILLICLHEGHIQKAPLFSGHLVYLRVLIPLVCPLSPPELFSHVLPRLFAPTFLPFYFHSVS